MPPARAAFYLTTLGGILFAIRAILHEPPPLLVSVGVAGLYLALITAGVLVLRLRMFADAISHHAKSGVVLTFDGSPPGNLGDRKAIIFVSEGGAELAEQGHVVGITTRDRFLVLRGPRRVKREVERALKAVEAATGKRPTFFRPPRGFTNPTIARVADQLDLTIVGWSPSVEDGAITRGNVLAEADAKNLRVVLLDSEGE